MEFCQERKQGVYSGEKIVSLSFIVFLSGITQTPVYTVYSKSNPLYWDSLKQLWQHKYSKARSSDSAHPVLGKSKHVLEAQLHCAGLQSYPEHDTRPQRPTA